MGRLIGGVVVGVCVCLFALDIGLAQTKTKKKADEKKLESQKEVMKEMAICLKDMESINDKLQKEKLSTSKLRKDLALQAERMAELSEAWKPFLQEQRMNFAEKLIACSDALAKSCKPGSKKAGIQEAVLAVRLACAECHKGYKPKEDADEKAH